MRCRRRACFCPTGGSIFLRGYRDSKRRVLDRIVLTAFIAHTQAKKKRRPRQGNEYRAHNPARFGFLGSGHFYYWAAHVSLVTDSLPCAMYLIWLGNFATMAARCATGDRWLLKVRFTRNDHDP